MTPGAGRIFRYRRYLAAGSISTLTARGELAQQTNVKLTSKPSKVHCSTVTEERTRNRQATAYRSLIFLFGLSKVFTYDLFNISKTHTRPRKHRRFRHRNPRLRSSVTKMISEGLATGKPTHGGRVAQASDVDSRRALPRAPSPAFALSH